MSLIFIDNDGTLVHDDQSISAKTVELLQNLRAMGHTIGIATGRMLGACKNISEVLGFEVDIVCSNGAVIYGKEGEILRADYLPDRAVKNFLYAIENEAKLRDDNDFKYHAFTNFKMYSSHESFVTDFFIGNKNTALFDSSFEVFIGDFKKPLLESGDRVINFGFGDLDDEKACIIKSIAENFTGLSTLISTKSILDVVQTGTNKWNGILKLCDIRGYDKGDIITFGNESNDIEMVTKSKVGVAMSNSKKDLLDVAPNICPSNNDDGVYEFLRKYYSI